MSDDRRWGFEEADDWADDDVRRDTPPADDTVDTLSGRDTDGVVTVTVTPTAEVLAVKLAADWRRSVNPRGLHSAVLAAANSATMQALARQVEQHPSTVPEPTPAQRDAASDETPITKDDALRLMGAVTADLAQFTRQMAEVTDHPITVESAGGHVHGSAQRGQVIKLSIDPGWASAVRESEMEAELLDVLGALRRRSTPHELAGGPRSPAIAELTALLSDPTTLLRRVGLLP